MKHDVAGDPCTGIKWTRRATRKIAQELRALSIVVSPRTVARLLHDLDFSLRVNRKQLSRGSGPDRNEQFEYIAAQRTHFAARGLPVVSIDSKKKEMVGNFKNGGATWRQTPELVSDHDFRSDAAGMATPFGIYDVGANRGAVFVGTSHDTPAFAAENVVRWWETEGRARYPGLTELLLLADGGGSNGPRTRAFKSALQTRLCDVHGLNYISTTNTQTGLRVTAHLVNQEYPKGMKISDAQMATLDVRRHATQPLRNYTIHPRT